jgi:hypothetical protein
MQRYILKLQIDIKGSCSDESRIARLKGMIHHAASQGLLTGESDDEVDSYTLQVHHTEIEKPKLQSARVVYCTDSYYFEVAIYRSLKKVTTEQMKSMVEDAIKHLKPFAFIESIALRGEVDWDMDVPETMVEFI